MKINILVITNVIIRGPNTLSVYKTIILSTIKCIIKSNSIKGAAVRLFIINTALDVLFCKQFCAYNVLFENVEPCGIVLLILKIFWKVQLVQFSFLCKNLKFLLSFLYVYSFCDPSDHAVTNTSSHQTFCTRSVSSNLGENINFVTFIQDRLLVNFCHNPGCRLEKPKQI